MESKKKNVLLGCTGSVASIKIPKIVEELQRFTEFIEIQVVATEHALHFFSPSSLPVGIKTNRDDVEWASWQKMGDPVLHIELRRWADMFVIAPLDANTLAKITNGICDNLLTCVVRAWDLDKPLLFAPAMNTYMWNHPITGQQISTMKHFDYIEIPTIEKKLACNDTGLGAMAEVDTIVKKIIDTLQLDIT